MNPMRRFLGRLLALCLAALPLVARGAELTLYTEEYPPINFSRDGKAAGLSTEVVEEILRRTGTRVPITVVPWARGYRSALEEPNVGLFVAMRTPEREPLLKWVGPVTTVRTSFYSRRGADLKVTSLDDARKVEVIAVPREWFSHQVLRSLGFANLDPVANTDVMVRLALTGRAQLMVADNQTLPAQLTQVDATMAQVDRHYTFLKTSSYIAFSRGTPDAVVRQWQQTLNEMKRDGSFARIYTRWLPGDMPPGIEAEPDMVPTPR
jgi:polar amino acid transport system substrate-binding protein